MALNVEFNQQTKRVKVTPGTVMVSCARSSSLYTCLYRIEGALGSPLRAQFSSLTNVLSHQFEVLEAAREQFQLDASRQYQLVHRGKSVELSIPFRLTGVSNNAAVELQELGAAEVQQVRVCVQLPDGKRLQASFAYDVTLESILSSFNLLPSQSPVRVRDGCHLWVECLNPSSR